VTSYQILLSSNGADARAEALRQTLLAKLDDLGIDHKFVSFCDDDSILGRDLKAPTVGAFLSERKNPAPRTGIAELVRDGFMVVPVVADLSHFGEYVFDDLRAINGMEFGNADPGLEQVAAVMLEGLNLLRRSRRLFISYKRADAQGVAIQLYEALDHNGFDAFLDTLSIRPGDPFQELLWHRLADTDVVVLLDSPGFLASRWTTKELATANSTNLQILQLTWPDRRVTASAAFSKELVLEERDFVSTTIGPDAKLNDAAVQKVVVESESLRARALAARHAYLVEEFCAEARRLGISFQIQPERIITIKGPSGKNAVAVPAVGVPDALRYHEIEIAIQKLPKPHPEVVLLYDERGIRERWLSHLAWLDGQLRVRSVQVAQCASWIRGI
jgi:TIR domain-containing protein